jgi:hypothetical protein
MLGDPFHLVGCVDVRARRLTVLTSLQIQTNLSCAGRSLPFTIVLVGCVGVRARRLTVLTPLQTQRRVRLKVCPLPTRHTHSRLTVLRDHVVLAGRSLPFTIVLVGCVGVRVSALTPLQVSSHRITGESPVCRSLNKLKQSSNHG